MNKFLKPVLIALFAGYILSCDKEELASTGSIYGVVTDADNGEPIRSASVSLNPGGLAITTGSDGKYEFLNLEPKQYTIQIMSSGYQTNNKKVSVIAGEIASGDLPLTRGTAKLKLSVESLNFGISSNALTFSIMNVGTAGSIAWTISENAEWMVVSPTNGTTDANKKSDIAVSLSRDKFTGSVEDVILITTGGESHSIVVNAESTSSETNGNPDIINLNAGLMALYTFDNENANDASENELTASFINSPDFTSETSSGSGKALLLSKIKEQYMNIPYNPFKGQYNYSISMWVKDFGQGVLFSAISSNGVNNDFPRLYANSDGKFTFCIGYEYTTPPPFTYLYKVIQDEKWHHISVVCKATESSKCLKSLYIDGQLTDSSEGSTSPGSTCSKVYIGGNSDGKYNVFTDNMKIDNIRFYTKSLDAREIKAIYDLEK